MQIDIRIEQSRSVHTARQTFWNKTTRYAEQKVCLS